MVYMRTAKRTVDSLNFWSGILFGLGAVAFIDEVIFHQLLHWHHFYDLSTTSVGLISDGLFHAFSWFATVASLFMVADLRRKDSFQKKRWIGAYMLGAGIFQLYDGIIQHKIMRLHQIRYVDEVFYYDLVWNVIAAVMIVIGLVILNSAKQNNKTKVSGEPVA